MNVEIKKCPFCGGEAKVINDDSPADLSGAEYAYGGQDNRRVRCCICGSEGKSIYKKFFRDFSPHTVRDFQNNPSLRAKWDDLYDEYCLEVDSQAIEAWNMRIKTS